MLPIEPPFLPMEAQPVTELPVGEDWQYEPKWDGLRCLAFRDGDDVYLQSKTGEPLAGSFPDIVARIRSLSPRTFVLDGEIVVPAGDASAHCFVAFDLLVTERATLLIDRMLIERRDRLESFAEKHFHAENGLRLSPHTRDVTVARKWLLDAESGFDGVVAKDLEAKYLSGERRGVQKVQALWSRR